MSLFQQQKSQTVEGIESKKGSKFPIMKYLDFQSIIKVSILLLFIAIIFSAICFLLGNSFRPKNLTHKYFAVNSTLLK